MTTSRRPARRTSRRARVFCRRLLLTSLFFFLAGVLQAATGHAGLAALSFLACTCSAWALASFLRRARTRRMR